MNSFDSTLEKLELLKVGKSIKPCLCYCRKWFYENVHTGKYLILWTDEIDTFKRNPLNDFDVLLCKYTN